MKKVSTKQRSWRVTKTPTREKGKIPVLTGGLNLNLSPELISLGFVADMDGMVIFSGLFRTDWELTNSNIALVDNIATTAKGSIPMCKAS